MRSVQMHNFVTSVTVTTFSNAPYLISHIGILKWSSLFDRKIKSFVNFSRDELLSDGTLGAISQFTKS